MLDPLTLLEEFLDQAAHEDPSALTSFLEKHHPADVAHLLEQCPPPTASLAFACLSEKQAAKVLAELGTPMRSALLENLTPKQIASFLEHLEADEAVDLVGLLEHPHRQAVLDQSTAETRKKVEHLLGYGKETAGGLMDSFVIRVSKGMSLAQAAESIRSLVRHHDADVLSHAYVVDEKGRLTGFVPLKAFLLHPPETQIETVMERHIQAIPVNMDQEAIARIFKRYNQTQMPVVNEDNLLLGKILVDDVMDVIEHEHKEDVFGMAGLSAEEDLNLPARHAIQRRLPWLFTNLIIYSAVVQVVAVFEPTIAKMAVLAVFMPIVSALGGNAGTQSLALIIRAIALGKLSGPAARRAVLRETLVGLANGMAIGTVLAATGYLYTKNVWLSLVLLVSQTFNIVFATSFGAALPLLLRKLGRDPAVSSPVLLTTLMDCAGFFTFLGLATLLLKKLGAG